MRTLGTLCALYQVKRSKIVVNKIFLVFHAAALTLKRDRNVKLMKVSIQRSSDSHTKKIHCVSEFRTDRITLSQRKFPAYPPAFLRPLPFYDSLVGW